MKVSPYMVRILPMDKKHEFKRRKLKKFKKASSLKIYLIGKINVEQENSFIKN